MCRQIAERALLVVLGAMRDGTKEVLALTSGYRESVESWSEVLRDLKARGIEAPRLLMADGNAAIWGAVRQVWPEAGEQRCWNHKMRNVLDHLLGLLTNQRFQALPRRRAGLTLGSHHILPHEASFLSPGRSPGIRWLTSYYLAERYVASFFRGLYPIVTKLAG